MGDSGTLAGAKKRGILTCGRRRKHMKNILFLAEATAR